MFTTLLAAASTVAFALAAGPSSIAVEDPADVDHGVDLRMVTVDNVDTFVRVKLTHADLTPGWESGAGGAVYLDTNRKKKGPELVFVGGYYEGTGYDLLETKGFGPAKWGDVVDRGKWRMRLNFDKETTTMRISRKALGGAKAVRVAVKVAGETGDGGVVHDWLGEPRSFTEWTKPSAG